MNRPGDSIVLIGMMGAGKSVVGECLQQRTRFAVFDTDKIVAAKFRSSITEIFTENGEDQFREAETAALRELSPDGQSIIVTGGGIVLREENIVMLKEFGILVWLDANEETLFARASQARDRPLLQTENPRETFFQLLKTRRPIYAKIADVQVDTSARTEKEIAEEILRRLSGLAFRATR